MKITDIHAHWFAPQWVALLEREADANGATMGRNAHGDVTITLPGVALVSSFPRDMVDVATLIANMDAARVDGCGELRILTTVVSRLAKPAIAAVALFSFLYTFNDFFLPLLYAGESPHHWVLSIGLSEFRSLHQVQWNLPMAATLLVMAPVIVIFFLAQRAFVEGVTLTGVKG